MVDEELEFPNKIKKEYITNNNEVDTIKTMIYYLVIDNDTVFVDDIIGFGNPFVDFFAMAFMMGILYGVVWGGLYKAVGIATESEKRKNEPEGLNKVPKKRAKPPTKPPKPDKKSIAAISKGE